jgi:transketolase
MTTATAPSIDWRTRSAKQTRLAFGQALLEVAERESRTVVLSADTQDLLGIRPFIERFRDRFIEVGIAEQNAIGIASGLATTGLRPYVCGYAPFLTARSMEQVRNDVAYANQRVVIGAAASGISLGVAGGTHHALEDLALMRSLPNMTVIVPADVDEAYRATLATLDIDGPVYLRLGGRTEEAPISDPEAPFRLGRAVQLRSGKDVTVIACGALVEMAVRASDALQREGIGARVLNMHTIKPLDRDAILAAAVETRAIVTAEEHHLAGGLGGAVAELLAVEHPTRMRMVGMPDVFAMVGPTVALRAKYGMSAEGIAQACQSALDPTSRAPNRGP